MAAGVPPDAESLGLGAWARAIQSPRPAVEAFASGAGVGRSVAAHTGISAHRQALIRPRTETCIGSQHPHPAQATAAPILARGRGPCAAPRSGSLVLRDPELAPSNAVSGDRAGFHASGAGPGTAARRQGPPKTAFVGPYGRTAVGGAVRPTQRPPFRVTAHRRTIDSVRALQFDDCSRQTGAVPTARCPARAKGLGASMPRTVFGTREYPWSTGGQRLRRAAVGPAPPADRRRTPGGSVEAMAGVSQARPQSGRTERRSGGMR